jgi:vacuolar-type H+-ATPase subunit H
MHDGGDFRDDTAVDILYLVDRLEELVGMGKRLPFSGRVMVDEEEFLVLVDQLRVAVPNEIKQAQRVIKERERVIGEAQDDAAKILEQARRTSEALLSEQGLYNEARQRGEDILRGAEEQSQRAKGDIDRFALEQFTEVERVIASTLRIFDDALRDALDAVQHAKNQIGR